MSSTKKTIFFWGLFSHSAAQIVTMVTAVIAVPIGLHYFGVTKYGVWTVIQTLMIYLSSSQFGIGSVATALMAKLTTPHERKAVLVRSFNLLVLISLLFLGLVALLWLNPRLWFPIFGAVPHALLKEATDATIVLATFYLLRLPLIAFLASYIGLQETYLERIYAGIFPSMAGLLSIMLTAYLGGGLVMLAMFLGASNLAISLASAGHFILRHKAIILTGDAKLPSNPTSLEILRSGGNFFVIGIAAMVVWNTDNLIISYFLGPDYVTSYSIAYKLYTIAYMVFIVFNASLWPMLGRAIGQGEWEWASSTYIKAALILPILGGLVWIGGMSFAKEIIYFWVGSSGYAGAWVIFAFGGCGYLLALVNMHASILGGMNVSHPLMWAGILEALVNLALSIVFVRIYGVAGVAMGTFAASLITAFWLAPAIMAHSTKGKMKMAWWPLVGHAVMVVLPALLAVVLINEYVLCAWGSFTFKVLIILGYLAISWRLLPPDLRIQAVQMVKLKRSGK